MKLAKHDHGLAQLIVDSLNEARGRGESGKVVFRDLPLAFPWNILADVLAFDTEVPEPERDRIAHEAAFAAAAEDTMTLGSYLGEASRLESVYLSRRPRSYVLLTQVSLSKSDDVPTVRLNNARISFPTVVPSRFLSARADLQKQSLRYLHAPPPTSYRWVRVGIRARCPAEAAEAALTRLELLLGLWNLILNRGKTWRIPLSASRPVNAIGLGPLHTAHEPDGAVASDTFWYEPDYFAPLDVVTLGADAETVFRSTADLRRKIQVVAYNELLADWIRAYNRALDQRSASRSFVMLWQALEVCTKTEHVKGYEVTVKRAIQ